MRGNRREDVAIGSLRLEHGAHDSPEQGVCVVEMASLIAGEEFSDRPDCVCEVIAAFLRSWNDRLGYSDRQRLAPYASRVVGTRAGKAVTRARRDACLDWAGANLDRGGLERFSALLGARSRIALLSGLRPALRLNEGAGEYAARLAFGRRDSDAAFELLDRLLEIEPEDRHVAPKTSPPRPGDAAGTRRERARAGIYALARLRARGGDGAITPGRGPLANGNGNGNANGNGHTSGNGARANGNGHRKTRARARAN
jgi:hypothetical protein